MTKLSKRKIKWAIDQVVKQKKSTKSVSALYKVTQRRIQQLVKRKLHSLHHKPY